MRGRRQARGSPSMRSTASPPCRRGATQISSRKRARSATGMRSSALSPSRGSLNNDRARAQPAFARVSALAASWHPSSQGKTLRNIPQRQRGGPFRQPSERVTDRRLRPPCTSSIRPSWGRRLSAWLRLYRGKSPFWPATPECLLFVALALSTKPSVAIMIAVATSLRDTFPAMAKSISV